MTDVTTMPPQAHGDLPGPNAWAHDGVHVARSVAEVEALRPVWESLAFDHLDADIDTFLTGVETIPQALRPHVAVMMRDGVPEAILAARFEDRELPARFGYATLYRPRLRCVTVVAGGAGGAASAIPALVDEVFQALRDREADAVFFHRLTVGSALQTSVAAQAPRLSRQRFLVPTRHWALDLPDAPQTLLPSLSKSLREEFRRRRRRLERDFGDRVRIRVFEAAADADELVRDLELVASTTYQRGLGAGFDATRDRALVELALRRRALYSWILYLDGRPCAYELGQRHGVSFVIGAKGYDPALRDRGVGWVVQLQMLEDLCRDPDVRTVDFGFGDADYKRRLANRSWLEVDAVVYGRTPRALTAMAGRTAVLGADRVIRRLAGDDRIAFAKRHWRSLRTPR